MTDSSPCRDGDDAGGRADHESPPSTPRWVKAFAVIAVVVILLLVIGILLGGGRHGPGRHTSSGDVGESIPPSRISVQVNQQPWS